MLNRQLPSMASLQAFEAAARHLSFTTAAEEMHVTQGAVSRRVRQLEELLNVELFHRMTRRIALTPAGRELLTAVDYLLGEFAEAVQRVAADGRPDSIVLSSLPTVASEWLMPRLHEFSRNGTLSDVRILTSIEPATFDTHGPHAAIRVGRLPGRSYGAGVPRVDLKMVADWSSVHADYLFTDRMLPVCSRALIGGSDTLPAEALQDLPLIHTTSRRHAWSDWFKSQGVRPGFPRLGELRFGHLFMSMQAAREGRGVALIPDIILAHAPMDDLVCPVASGLASSAEYFLLMPKDSLANSELAAFRTWLIGEAERARATIAARFPGA